MDSNLILNQLSSAAGVQAKVKAQQNPAVGGDAFQALLNGGENVAQASSAGPSATQMFAQMGQGVMMPPQGLALQSTREAQFVAQVGEARQNLYGKILGDNGADKLAGLGLAESLIRFRALEIEGPVLNFSGAEASV